MKKFAIAFGYAAVILAFSATAATAGTATFTSVSSFDSATSGLTTGDFSDVPTPNSGGMNPGAFGGYNPLQGYSSLEGASFSTPNVGGSVNVNSAYFYGPADLPAPYLVNSTYTGTGADVIDIDLPHAATAFGLDFTTLFNSTTATFTLSNGFSTDVPMTVAYPNTPEFLGFTSTTPFSSITFSVPSQQSIVISDFSFGTANPVPEPATWLTLILGMGIVGTAMRRRLPVLRRA